MKFITYICVLLLALVPPAAATPDSLALPDIGDSSATAFSPADEKRFGSEMMRSIRHSGRLLTDPEVEEYIQQLGYRLVSTSTQSAAGFTFFVISDPSINAFAMPGGYIGVHTGLITASRSESELAGVMAHEIAHVTQHHLARSFERAGDMNLPMTAAVIAAILLGGSNPQMGEAALAATMAGSAQMQLDFTRSNEREADRVGIQMLAGAGFDPQGMPGFFERLQQEYRYTSTGVPEFLSTHPVTLDRIADARNRAEQYPSISAADNLNYRLVQARLRVLAARNLDVLARQYRDALAASNGSGDTADRYGYALVLARQREYAHSRELLTALHHADPGRIAYMLALAQVEGEDHRPAAAEKIYRSGLQLHPNNSLLTLALAEHLLQRGEHAATTTLLREHTRNRQVVPRAYELLAEAETRSGNKGIAHIALADYYHSLGETQTAIEQLNLARRSGGLDFYYQSLLEAKLVQLQEEAAAMARH
ncbi:MAG: M48 family metalloprotease [Candidatus Zixiibacteriota bacterium]